jgi:tetratricopeptide (TPR) repeat protein
VYAVFNSAGSNPYFFDAEPSAFVPTLRAGEGRLLATALACVKSFAGPAEVGLFYLKKASGLAIPFENPDNANFYYAVLKDPLLRFLPNYALLLPLSVIGFILALKRWKDLMPLIPFSLSLLLSVMVTLPLSRYRTTLAVFLTPFAGLALARVVGWIKERRVVRLTLSASAFALILAAAAAWQARAFFGGRPAGIFTYRAQEFFVEADHDSKQARPAEAIGEMLLLLRLNPDRSVRSGALLKLAALLRASGQEAAAREAIEAAVEASPRDPMLLMAAGDFHMDTLHDAIRARALYESALLLRPPGALDRALRIRLASLEAIE